MRVNCWRNSEGLRLSAFSILAISAIMFFFSACVVATERGPYYAHEPSSRLGDLHGVQGMWFFASANITGKLEFYWDGHAWGGRIWLDAYQQWEPLTDIIFDPRTGELQFTRPNFNIRYSGTLSHDRIVGSFTYQGTAYSWEATRQEVKTRGPLLDLRRIQGMWFFASANITGKLEFYWDGHAWGGRIWLDAYQQWEPLTDIIFDPRTGELQFTRPNFNIRYSGTLSHDRIVGSFTYQGITYSWEARHQ